ncbi:hypothetical protein BD626DRAFT_121482 [Schizophyllum amplum]|uniref:F-box domain-containing protein n=1 Tax=Schizophyllum amplum TaxID=97359 RepID=A0A550C7G4_9AGAR|nr:hypothetical protein BD626DRAFT_121482 [Auriculariopsis ampla]
MDLPQLLNLNYDVLEHVFLHCLPDEPFVHPARTAGPLLVSHVCSSWRQQAISMPALWASIDIHVTRRGVSPSPEVIAAWLGRSGTRPLRIRLSVPEKPGVEGWQNSEIAFRAILPFHRRWQKLELRLRLFLPLQVLDEVAPEALTELRALHVVVPGTLDDAWKHLRRILDGVSHLEYLGLEADLSEHLPAGPLPFAALRALDMHNVALPVVDCLHVLESAQALESLMLRIAVAPAATVLPGVKHSTLLQLSLYSVALDADAFLDAATLPNLRNMTIICGHRIPPNKFTSFFRRSRCRLRCLHLCTPVDDADTVVQILRNCSTTLESFHLGLLCDEALPMDALLQALIIEDEDQYEDVFCPRLHSLLLGPGSVVESEVANAFLHSRARTARPGVAKLDAVIMRVNGN